MKFSRSICALVVTAILCLTFASCKEGKDNVKNTGSTIGTKAGAEVNIGEFGKYENDGLETADLGGYKFTIATSKKDMIFPAEGKSDYEDARLQLIQDIETRFNCKIEIVEIPYGNDAFNQLQPRIAAGDKVADIIMTSIWETGNYITSKIVQDLKQIPHLQLDKPWWNQSMMDSADIGGKVMVGVNSIDMPIDNASVMFFNKKIAEELELGDLYELVEKKEWTWDKFVEMSKKAIKDLDGNGKMDRTDRFGFGGPTDDTFNAFVVSGGLKYVDKVDGKNVFGMKSAETLSVLGEVQKIFGSYNIKYPENGDWSNNLRAFTGDLTLFFPASPSSGATFLKNMESDYGILPYPIGGSATDYMADCNHNTQCVMIPTTNTDVEKTGLILEALSFATWKLTPQRLEYYDTKMVKDEESMVTINNLLDKVVFDKRMIVYSSAFCEGVQAKITKAVLDPNGDYGSVIESVSDVANTTLNDFYGQ